MPRVSIDLAAGGGPGEIKGDWIAALDRTLDWHDEPRSYRLLNAVVRALHMNFADQTVLPEGLQIARCGTALSDMTHETVPGLSRLDAALLLRQVETGFRPDRLDSPEAAVLAVLDVLDELVDEPRLGAIRRALLQCANTVTFDVTAHRWSATWSSPLAPPAFPERLKRFMAARHDSRHAGRP